MIPANQLRCSASSRTSSAGSLARSLAARGWRFDSLRAGQILTYGDEPMSGTDDDWAPAEWADEADDPEGAVGDPSAKEGRGE